MMSTYAVDKDGLAVDPAGLIPGQERDDRRDLVWDGDTLLRVEVGEEVDELLRLAVAEQFGVDRTRPNRVDVDAAGTKVFRKHTRHLLHGTLRRSVDEVVWWNAREPGRRRGNEEYATTCSWYQGSVTWSKRTSSAVTYQLSCVSMQSSP